MASTQWAVVVPVKELDLAKTRLVGLAPDHRSALALAMACDVVTAALEARSVAGVVVVTNDSAAAAELRDLGALVVADVTASGLDDAVVCAARTATSWWPRCGVAAVSSDLACATGPVLDLFLQRAADHPRSILADRTGDGTTVLAAQPGTQLDPRYGASSRDRHVLSGAHQVDAHGLERLTLDVDTPQDLDDAVALGVGLHTAAVMLRGDSR